LLSKNNQNIHYSPQVILNSSPLLQAKAEKQVDIFEKAKLLAAKYQGECQSSSFSICKGKNSLKFKCVNNHVFFMPIEEIESSNTTIYKNSVTGVATSPSASIYSTSNSNEWCYKCYNFYQTCIEVATRVGIQVIEGLFSQKITLKCFKKCHSFQISYSKKLNTLSCADCRKEEREEWKEQLKQEELIRNQIYL
jgi:hypothetical protein